MCICISQKLKKTAEANKKQNKKKYQTNLHAYNCRYVTYKSIKNGNTTTPLHTHAYVYVMWHRSSLKYIQ